MLRSWNSLVAPSGCRRMARLLTSCPQSSVSHQVLGSRISEFAWASSGRPHAPQLAASRRSMTSAYRGGRHQVGLTCGAATASSASRGGMHFAVGEPKMPKRVTTFGNNTGYFDMCDHTKRRERQRAQERSGRGGARGVYPHSKVVRAR